MAIVTANPVLEKWKNTKLFDETYIVGLITGG
jgi:hypothetical protein